MLSTDYYPAGMTARDFRGVTAEDAVIHFTCGSDDPPCVFEGDVEVTVEHGLAQGTCPSCERWFEEDLNP